MKDNNDNQPRIFGKIWDFEHAEQTRRALSTVNDKKDDTAVPDCQDDPKDSTITRRMKQEIFDAIFDLSIAVERDPSIPVNKIKKLGDLWAGVLVEQLWDGLINKAQSGYIGLPGEKVRYEVYETFNERHAKLVYTLKRSKCNVVSCLPNEFLKRLVAAPEWELNHKVNNRGQAEAKKVSLKVAEKAKKSGDCKQTADGDWKYKDGTTLSAASDKNTRILEAKEELKVSRTSKKRKVSALNPPLMGGSNEDNP